MPLGHAVNLRVSLSFYVQSAHVYALEIEPAYIDVSVKRWEAFTGQKAQRKQ